MELTKRYSGWILAGSICEAIDQSRKVYNTSVLIGPQGIICIYRKTHCFNAIVNGIEISESKTFETGHSPTLGSVQGIPVGLSICFDLRFSELYLSYRQQGAKILCIPAAFTSPTGEAHWEVLLRARAIESQCFVIAPNQVGKGAYPTPSYGHSMIVDPWGKILAKGDPESEGVWQADLDFTFLDQVRTHFPMVRTV
jgi:predicted amidohydrolase